MTALFATHLYICAFNKVLKKIRTVQLSFLVKLALHLIEENNKTWLAHSPIEWHLKWTCSISFRKSLTVMQCTLRSLCDSGVLESFPEPLASKLCGSQMFDVLASKRNPHVFQIQTFREPREKQSSSNAFKLLVRIKWDDDLMFDKILNWWWVFKKVIANKRIS